MAERASAPSIEATRVASTPARSEWVRGWKIVAVGLLAYVFGTTGMFFTFGLFLKPLNSEFHWSREAISAYLSISSVTFLISAPVIGRLADRYGAKRLIIFCTTAAATVFASQGLLTGHLWHFYALAFFGGLFAPGASTLTYGKIISNWFDRSRGIALSTLACGTGIAAMIAPAVAERLIAAFGWRNGYLLLGLIAIVLGTLPVALVVTENSSSVTTSAVPAAGGSLGAARQLTVHTLRNYVFWALAGVSFMIGASYVGVLAHLIPILTDHGMSAANAAWTFSLLGAAAIIGHLLVGASFDRFAPSRVAALMLMLSGLGVASLGSAHSMTTMVLASMLLGATLGADLDLTPYLVSRYFGLPSYGEVLGYLFAAGALGSACAPFLMGRVFDLYHSYSLMTSLIAGGALLAALLAFTLPQPQEGYKPKLV